MGTDQSVRCEAHYSPVAVVGIGLVWLVGVVAVAVEGPRQPSYHHEYEYFFALAIFCGLLALTVGVGLVRRRYFVRAVEFTEAQVRLESRAGVRTMRVAEVYAVHVEHSGDTESGYDKTELLLEWRYRSKRIVCDHHDPALGPALVRLLPEHVQVRERWQQLQEPDPT